jgi:hypothetical protein
LLGQRWCHEVVIAEPMVRILAESSRSHRGGEVAVRRSNDLNPRRAPR